MKHVSYEQWLKYVKDELTEDVRISYENHLYSCEQCLEFYLQAVAEHEAHLPVMSEQDHFTDRLMAEISSAQAEESVEKPGVNKKRVKPFYQSAFFHYTFAAAMTLLFMVTGVFQSITQYADTVQDTSFTDKSPSITEGIVDKTFAWMDSLENQDREAKE